MSTLTNADKLGIVNQHLKTVDYAIYGSELDLIEAQAVSPVDQSLVTLTNTRLESLNAKRSALAAEAATLEE